MMMKTIKCCLIISFSFPSALEFYCTSLFLKLLFKKNLDLPRGIGVYHLFHLFAGLISSTV